jgi:hypothetical protein
MADGDLGQDDFDVAFSFSRPIAADFVSAAGTIQNAAVDAPRFDHDTNGDPLGLLIEGGPVLGQADRVKIDPLMLAEDIVGQEVTVFHARTMPDGTVERRAWYSRDAIATINGLLAGVGRHHSIGLIAGFRENKGGPEETGYVRYRGQSWQLAELLAVGDGKLLSDEAGRPLIGA